MRANVFTEKVDRYVDDGNGNANSNSDDDDNTKDHDHGTYTIHPIPMCVYTLVHMNKLNSIGSLADGNCHGEEMYRIHFYTYSFRAPYESEYDIYEWKFRFV